MVALHHDIDDEKTAQAAAIPTDTVSPSRSSVQVDDDNGMIDCFRRAVRATEPPMAQTTDADDDVEEVVEEEEQSLWMTDSVHDLQPQTLPEKFQQQVSRDHLTVTLTRINNNNNKEQQDVDEMTMTTKTLLYLSDLQCGICWDVLEKPVGCGCCTGRFCHACLEQTATTTAIDETTTIFQCPTCRRSLSRTFSTCTTSSNTADVVPSSSLEQPSQQSPPQSQPEQQDEQQPALLVVPDPTLEHQIAMAMAPCRYPDCNIQLPVQQWHQHEMSCPYRIVQCRYAKYGCPFIGTFQQEQQHHHQQQEEEPPQCIFAPWKELLEELRILRLSQHTRYQQILQRMKQARHQQQTQKEQYEQQLAQYQTQIEEMKQTQQITNDRLKRLSSYELYNPLHLIIFAEKALIETLEYRKQALSNRFLHANPKQVQASAYNLVALIPMAFVAYLRVVQALFNIVYYASAKSTWIILQFAWQRCMAWTGISEEYIPLTEHYILSDPEFRNHVDLVWFLLMNFYKFLTLFGLVVLIIVTFHIDEKSPVEWQSWKRLSSSSSSSSSVLSSVVSLWQWISSWLWTSSWDGDVAWHYQTLTSLALAGIYYISLDFSTPHPYTMKEFLSIMTVHGYMTLCIPVAMARAAISSFNPIDRDNYRDETGLNLLSNQRVSFFEETAIALTTGNAVQPLLFALEYGALTQYLGFMTCLDGLGLYIYLMDILNLCSPRLCHFFKLTGVHAYAEGCMKGPINIFLHLYFVVRLGTMALMIPQSEFQSLAESAGKALQAHLALNLIYSLLACLGNQIGNILFQRTLVKCSTIDAGAGVLGPMHNIIAEGVVACLIWGFCFVPIAVDLFAV